MAWFIEAREIKISMLREMLDRIHRAREENIPTVILQDNVGR